MTLRQFCKEWYWTVAFLKKRIRRLRWELKQVRTKNPDYCGFYEDKIPELERRLKEYL